VEVLRVLVGVDWESLFYELQQLGFDVDGPVDVVLHPHKEPEGVFALEV
jgi:hypothetical protein